MTTTAGNDLAFRIDYNHGGRVRHVESIRNAAVERVDGDVVRYLDLGETGIGVAVTARKEGTFTRWSLAMEARRELLVSRVHFPYLVLPYESEHGPVRVVEPAGLGRLRTDPEPHDLPPDSAQTWDIDAGPIHSAHYPGTIFAQFLAWYDDSTGVYVACEDATGAPQVLRAVHRDGGIGLGVAYIVGWSGPGHWELGYPAVVGSFTGDWHAAADISRRWWCAAHPDVPPLADRTDLPEWLADAPLHVVIRVRGEGGRRPGHEPRRVHAARERVPAAGRAGEVGGRAAVAHRDGVGTARTVGLPRLLSSGRR